MNLPDPTTCDEPTLARFAGDLSIARLDGENVETWRARIVAAFEDVDVLDLAVPTPNAPAPMVLGGMKLGD